MARVPVYERTERLRPIHRQGVDVRANPAAFGGGVGLSNLGRGLDRLGLAFQQRQELEDMTLAKDKLNNFEKWRQARMYGPEGYMLTAGQDASYQRQALMTEADAVRTEMGEGLSGKAQTYYLQARPGGTVTPCIRPNSSL